MLKSFSWLFLLGILYIQIYMWVFNQLLFNHWEWCEFYSFHRAIQLNHHPFFEESFPGCKESTCWCRSCRRHMFDLWVWKIPCSRNGNPFQYSCLGIPMDRGAWWASQKSWTQLTTTTIYWRDCPFHWVFLNSLLNVSQLCMHEFISMLSVLLPWSMCLFWYQYHTVLITKVL